MLRRTLLASPLALLAAPALAQTLAAPPMRTVWSIASSEGIDALAFLGPLSGKPFYADYYPDELAAFKPRLGEAVIDALMSLDAEHDAAGGLLWPSLTLIFSGGPDSDIAELLASLDAAETVLAPPFRASVYWDQADWDRFIGGRDRLRLVLTGLRDAGFADFRNERTAGPAARKTAELTTLFPGSTSSPNRNGFWVARWIPASGWSCRGSAARMASRFRGSGSSPMSRPATRSRC